MKLYELTRIFEGTQIFKAYDENGKFLVENPSWENPIERPFLMGDVKSYKIENGYIEVTIEPKEILTLKNYVDLQICKGNLIYCKNVENSETFSFSPNGIKNMNEISDGECLTLYEKALVVGFKEHDNGFANTVLCVIPKTE